MVVRGYPFLGANFKTAIGAIFKSSPGHNHENHENDDSVGGNKVQDMLAEFDTFGSSYGYISHDCVKLYCHQGGPSCTFCPFWGTFLRFLGLHQFSSLIVGFPLDFSLVTGLSLGCPLEGGLGGTYGLMGSRYFG